MRRALVAAALLAALVLTQAGAAADSPPPPGAEGDNGSCNKDDPAYPYAETFRARVARPDRAVLHGGVWTCVGRNESSRLILSDWARESAALVYYYEWGRTRAYGTRSQMLRTVRDAESGIRSATAALIVNDLSPGYTYHFRIVARSDLYPDRGWRRGDDRTFRTPNRSLTDRSCRDPVVRTVAQQRAPAGRLLRLSGTGLGRTGSVSIGGKQASVRRWSPKRVMVSAPPGTGPRARIVVTCGEGVSSARTPDAPAVRVSGL
jgi:hypothetical protein